MRELTPVLEHLDAILEELKAQIQGQLYGGLNGRASGTLGFRPTEEARGPAPAWVD